jgi:ABC-2 type transport system permease protein
MYFNSGQTGEHTLGVVASGSFTSYFDSEAGKALEEEVEDVATGLLSRSPDSARLIVISSPSMFSDDVVQLLSGMGAGDALANLTFMANLIDWSTQDESLLSIRSRSHFQRTLYPLDKKKQMFWEYLNYLLALLVLATIGVGQQLRIESRRRKYRELLNS